MNPKPTVTGSNATPQGISRYDALTLYVMSGTGNSLRAARWAEQVAAALGMKTTLRMMDDPSPWPDSGTGTRQLVGLCMPTHGFSAPWLAIKFAARIPRANGAEAFCVATRASTKMGPWATPGMSGSASWLIGLMLMLKGYSIRGLLGLDMPSNWLQVHPGFGPANIAFVAHKAKPRVIWLMDRMLSGHLGIPPAGFLYDLVSGALMLPVSVLYLLYGRLFFGKLFFATNRCDGCGLCEMSCPTQGVKVVGPGTPRPYWNYHCESCNRCVAYCPRHAIEIGHHWAIGLTVLSLVPFVPFVMSDAPIWTRWFDLLGLWGGVAAVIAFWYVGLLALYPLFFLALKLRPVNWLATFTAVTRFWRRHKDPNTRLADLVPKQRREAWKQVGQRRRKANTGPSSASEHAPKT